MRIAICMKQVPFSSNGRMDEETGSVIRTTTSVANPADLVGLEYAIRMKEACNCHVDVFTMGPEKAEDVLKTAYAFGSDRGFLVNDKAFAGSDILTTSYVLSQAMKLKGPYDLVICGSHTTDGDTGLVGSALAEWMRIPYFDRVRNLSDITENTIRIERITEEKKICMDVLLPCVLSVHEKAVVPRIPSLKAKLHSKKQESIRISHAELSDQNMEHYGFKGSATKVKKIYSPRQNRKRELRRGTKEEIASMIIEILEKKEII